MANRNPKTANLKPWKKGQSGNPGGRTKTSREITQLALEGSKKAIKRLLQLVDSKDERVALSAAIAVLDRGCGKPTQVMQHAGDPENPLQSGAKIEMVIVDPKPTIDRPPEETREQWLARRARELGVSTPIQPANGRAN
jgi:hypothetical protein